MSKPLGIDFTGKTFGRLLVLRRTGTRGKQILWACQCSCGNIHEVVSGLLLNGNTKSCGCLRREVTSARLSKGRKKHYREYVVWLSLRARCNRLSHPDYQSYGGRGLYVDGAWNSFDTFLADMGPRPVGTSIERLDNSKGYSKENCKWGTPTEQARNTRRNRYLTAFGITRIMRDWALELGMQDTHVHRWLKRGKTIQQLCERRGYVVR